MKWGVLLLILLSALVAAAQEQTDRRSGLNLTSPLMVSGGYENHLLTGNTTINDSTLLLTGPTFTVSKFTPRTDFSLRYTPEGELFRHYPSLNAWNHSAGLHFEYKMSPRLTVAANNSFVSTQDPTRTLGETVFLLPRGDFLENIAGAGINYNATRTVMLSLAFDNTYSDLSVPAYLQTMKLRQLGNIGTAGISFTVQRHHNFSLSYSLLSLKDLTGTAGVLRSTAGLGTTHSGNFAYRYVGLRGFAFGASGGIMRGSIHSYLVTSDIQKSWRTLLLDVGYSRQVSLFRGITTIVSGVPITGVLDTRLASGVLPQDVIQAATLHYREMLGRRVGIDVRGLVGRTNSLALNRNINSATGRGRIYFRVADRLTWFFGAELYNQNFNELLLTSLARRRYYTGFMVSLSRQPQPLETYAQSPQENDAPRDIEDTWPKDWGEE